jgi:photosystem II stability/assembly factor-like uncharacterized protein
MSGFTPPRPGSRIIGLVCLCTLASVVAVPASTTTTPPAEAYAWNNVAIEGGGYVTGLLFHPSAPGVLYARTDVGGAYRWDGAGRRWQPLNDAISRENSELAGVISFAVDAQDPSRLYLACGSYLPEWAKPAALLRSSDQGATWQQAPLPFKLGGNADGRSTGERLQVDPHDGRVLLLGTNQDGLWRSPDGARTWQKVRSFPASRLTFVLFDPHGSHEGQPTPMIYAGAGDLKNPPLFRTADGGKNWSVVPGQPTGLLVQHAAVDAAGTLYLTYANGPGPNDTTNGAVWKYAPGNGVWTNISPCTTNPALRDTFSFAGLAVDQKAPGTLMVSTLDRWTVGDEIFRSTDGGATWRPMLAGSPWDFASAPYIKTFKPHWIGAVALDPVDSGHALFVTGYGLWSTTEATAPDRGGLTSWKFDCAGLEETVVGALASPPAGAPLLSALWDIGGFRHDDLNKSPVAGAHYPPNGSNPGIDFAEQVPTKVVRTHSGPARGALSLDGGISWKDFPTTPPPARTIGPGVIAISADGRRLVWLPKGSAPYFSSDEGSTWTRSHTDFVSASDYRTSVPVADRVNPTKFYIYDMITGQLHVSTDGGVKFSTAIKLPIAGGLLRAEPGAEGHLWLPLPTGLYLSTDAGHSFSPLPSVQAAFQMGFGRPAAGSVKPALFLSGRVQQTTSIFRSDDGGGSWINICEPQRQWGWINVVAGDPRVFGRVYLGTGGRGIIYGQPQSP